MRVAIGSDHAGFRKSLGDLGGCLGGRDAATSVCHQLNSVPSIHMRFRMTAILRDGGFGLSSPKPLAPNISARGSAARQPLRRDNCVA